MGIASKSIDIAWNQLKNGLGGMIWQRALASLFPSTEMKLLGTDVSDEKIEIARRGEYPWYSLKGLPMDWHAPLTCLKAF